MDGWMDMFEMAHVIIWTQFIDFMLKKKNLLWIRMKELHFPEFITCVSFNYNSISFSSCYLAFCGDITNTHLKLDN